MNLLYRFESESLHWSMSGTRTVTHGPITTEKRVHVSDKRAIAEQVDHVVDEVRLATQRFVAGKALVRANLTAGLDSRGVLAFLAAAKPAELVLSTLGDESSLDVRVARRLAKMIGAEHRHSMPGPPKEPAFEAHNRLRAFTLDGMGDARKALSPLPRWNTKRNILVGGEGGEIFRGFFYQYFPSGHVSRAPEAITPTLFRWRFRRATGLPFRDPLLVKRIQERLTGSLATLAELGTSGYDTLDLFYLYERYSQWGASGERASWSRR